MELMATEISVFDTEEFEKLIAEKDIRIANALVDTVLDNLKGKKKHHHALSVLVVQDQTIYDITVDRAEFVTTLKRYLSLFEEKEMYERCAEIVKAVKYLENKPKRGRPKKNLDK